MGNNNVLLKLVLSSNGIDVYVIVFCNWINQSINQLFNHSINQSPSKPVVRLLCNKLNSDNRQSSHND